MPTPIFTLQPQTFGFLSHVLRGRSTGSAASASLLLDVWVPQFYLCLCGSLQFAKSHSGQSSLQGDIHTPEVGVIACTLHCQSLAGGQSGWQTH